MDGLGGGRFGMMVMAMAAVGTASEAVARTEAEILNVPLSMLCVAMAGAMIGYVLLPAQDAARLTTPVACWKKKVVFWTLAAIPLVAATLGYAFVSAWCVQVGVGLVHTVTRLTVEQSLVIPATGLAGVGIRPWLPALLRAVERRASVVIGGGT